VRLLERDHPLDVLVDRAQRAVAGNGRVVLVAGEAGIGKTVLLRAFVERMPAVARPLWGMCDSLSTHRPLGPLRDVAAELGPAVPALLGGTAAQHEIFAAVLDALRSRPRVFVVEDLHWADEATLDLVRFLCRCCWCCRTATRSGSAIPSTRSSATWSPRPTRVGSS
jgi:predicted ATPase